MIVLPQDEIDHLKELMDDLLKQQYSMSVGDFKRRWKLSSEEYEMIYDLCMPLIREANVKKYWAIKYQSMIRSLKAIFKQRKTLSDIQFYKELRRTVFAQSTGVFEMLEAAGVEES